MAILGKLKVTGAIITVCCNVAMVGNSIQANAVMIDVPVSSESVTEAGIVQPLARHEWKYKIMNGNLYKRLMDSKTGQWLGDWILVGPV